MVMPRAWRGRHDERARAPRPGSLDRRFDYHMTQSRDPGALFFQLWFVGRAGSMGYLR